MFPTLTFILVLLSALGGWCMALIFIKILFKPYVPKKIIGLTVQGFVPFVQSTMSLSIAAAIKQECLSESMLKQQLQNPALLQKMAPAIEAHVDLFLKEKLSVAFPLMSKLMGEKTLQKFKDAFLLEVETILPSLLGSYGKNLLESEEIEKSIAEKIRHFSLPDLEAKMNKYAAKSVLKFKLVGILIGTLIGLLQMMVVYLMINK
ncbi:MAG: hypothetical protein WEA59_08730 [Ferruginibacter sp.]